MSPRVYLDYTQDELDWQYDHSRRFGDTGAFVADRARESARVRARIEGVLDVPYGPGEGELLDIFPAAQHGAPVAVFIHGGAWQRGHKDNASYPAAALVPAGVTLVATNFAAVPPATLDELVRQNRAALAWVGRNIARYGGDSARIHVIGHSSGAHLAAMAACTDWNGAFGLPADLVKGATCMSGMYDLAPIRLSYRNDYLHLDEAACRRNSPIHNIPATAPPLIVGCGAEETAEFKRQPRAFAEAWRAAGHRCTFLELEGRHHFSVALAFAEPEGPLLKAVLEQIGV